MGISSGIVALEGAVLRRILAMLASLLEDTLLGLREVGWEGDELGEARGLARGLTRTLTTSGCFCSRNR